MSKLYTAVQSVTPPIVFRLFKNTFIYSSIKKINDKISKKDPRLYTINNGLLKNRKIFFEGEVNWQKEMINGSYDDYFFNYIKQKQLSGKTILDIGAHIGYHSLCFAELVGKSGRVFAFEPNPYNVVYIKEALKNNTDLAKRIELFEIALSNKDGLEDFIFSDKVEEGMSSGSFIDSADTIWEKEVFEKITGFKRMRVKTLSLDSLDQTVDGGIKPDVLKIDVEGAESLVLEGARRMILKYSPIILLEIHSMLNMYLILNFFYKIGYETELLKTEKDGRCFISATKL